MELAISLKRKGYAAGEYRFKGKGCIAAAFFWAKAGKRLEGWEAFGYIPVQANGKGILRMTGERGIPREADQICIRSIRPDFSKTEEKFFPIPEAFRPGRIQGTDITEKEKIRFLVISDLHLTLRRTGFIENLWKRLKSRHFDGILAAGDWVNDGIPEQFEALKAGIKGCLEGVFITGTAGNHDYPEKPIPYAGSEISGYPMFQDWLGLRAGDLGVEWETDPSGIYRTRIKNLEIIGVNGAAHWRRLTLGEEQLHVLERLLEEGGESRRRLIICHGPLAAFTPRNRNGKGKIYLDRDRELCRVLENHKNIIFLSGHTHFSPNMPEGSVRRSAQGNIYLDAGSICTMEVKGREELIPGSWTEGVYFELKMGEDEIEILARSVADDRIFPRGYYRFPLD